MVDSLSISGNEEKRSSPSVYISQSPSLTAGEKKNKKSVASLSIRRNEEKRSILSVYTSRSPSLTAGEKQTGTFHTLLGRGASCAASCAVGRAASHAANHAASGSRSQDSREGALKRGKKIAERFIFQTRRCSLCGCTAVCSGGQAGLESIQQRSCCQRVAVLVLFCCVEGPSAAVFLSHFSCGSSCVE